MLSEGLQVCYQRLCVIFQQAAAGCGCAAAALVQKDDAIVLGVEEASVAKTQDGRNGMVTLDMVIHVVRPDEQGVQGQSLDLVAGAVQSSEKQQNVRVGISTSVGTIIQNT